MPMERRQGNVFAIVALMITLLTNIIALTWGASQMSSAVNGLETTTSELGTTVKEIQQLIAKLDVRMSIQEAKSQ